MITDFDLDEDTLFLSAYASRFETLADIQESSGVTERDGVIGLIINFGEGDQLFVPGAINLSQLTVVF